MGTEQHSWMVGVLIPQSDALADPGAVLAKLEAAVGKSESSGMVLHEIAGTPGSRDAEWSCDTEAEAQVLRKKLADEIEELKVEGITITGPELT